MATYPWIWYSSASRSSFGSFYDGGTTAAEPLASVNVALTTKNTDFGRVHRSAIYVKNGVSGRDYEYEAVLIFSNSSLPTDELNLDLYNVCDLDLRSLVNDNGNGYSAFYVRVGYNIDGGSDTSKGIYSRTNVSTTMNNLSTSYSYTNPPVPIYTDRQQWLDYVKIQEWETVPSVTGKLGTQVLSRVKADELNNGNPVSNASSSVIQSLSESTKLANLAQGLSAETPILYTDDVNYMSLTPTANNTCTLKFYLDNSLIYTLTGVSTNTYLQFLKDDAGEVEKPSLIYKSGSDTYLFHPDFSSDGRDVVRYDANNIVPVGNFSATSSLDNAPEGSLCSSTLDSYIINNGEIYLDDTVAPYGDYLIWGYDPTKNQDVIDPNGTITFHASYKRTDTIPQNTGYSLLYLWMCYKEAWDDDRADYSSDFIESWGTRSYWSGFLSAAAWDNTESVGFNTAWHDTDFNPNTYFTLNTWYDAKQIWQLTNGNITRAEFYLDNVLVNSYDITEPEELTPCFNVINSNKRLTSITLSICPYLHVKDVYISYE